MPDLAKCSRAGCRAREAEPGAFSACKRCHTKSYCTNECRTADECTGHSACTMLALLEAADEGPFDAAQFQQAHRLIMNQPMRTDPPLSDDLASQLPLDETPRTRPSNTGITLATLDALRAALSHPPRDPLALPPGLLASGLLHALGTLFPPLPEGVRKFDRDDYINHMAIDATAGVLNALLTHPIQAALLAQQKATPNLSRAAAALPNALEPWLRAMRVITGSYRHTPWLVMSCLMGDEPAEVALCKVLSAQLQAAAGLPRLCTVPAALGAESMLLLGHLRALQGLAGRGVMSLPEEPPTGTNLAISGSDKLAVLLERRAVALPHVGLLEVLVAALESSEEGTYNSLHRRPESLKALAQPLEALAADPMVWQHGPYAFHLQTMVKLLDCTALVAGLDGLNQVAQHMARPAIAALDALLDLGRDDRSAAAPTVVACLTVMAHMAYTTNGMSAMAAAGCPPRWLELAPRWKAPPQVLEMLLLALQVPFSDPANDVYFRKIRATNGDGNWVWCTLQTPQRQQRPPLLDKQMGSSVAMDSIAHLLESVKDNRCMMLLVFLLRTAVNPTTGIRITRPIEDALITLCHPPLRPWALDTVGPRNADVAGFLAEVRKVHWTPQVMGIGVLVLHYTQPVAGGLAASRLQPAVPPGLLPAAVQWLKACTREGEAEEGLLLTYRISVTALWSTLGTAAAYTTAFLRQQRVPELWFRLLPLLSNQGTDTAMVAAGHMMHVMIRNSNRDGDRGASFMLLVKSLVAKGNNGDPILSYFCQRAAAAQSEGVRLLSVIDEDPQQMLFVLVGYFSGDARRCEEAAQKLLAATGVWDLFKAVADGGMQARVQGPVHVGMLALLGFLQHCLVEAGASQREQVVALVRRLGRRTLEEVLQSASLVYTGPGDHLARPEVFHRVFEEDRSAASVSKAAAGRSTAAAGSGTGGSGIDSSRSRGSTSGSRGSRAGTTGSSSGSLPAAVTTVRPSAGKGAGQGQAAGPGASVGSGSSSSSSSRRRAGTSSSSGTSAAVAAVCPVDGQGAGQGRAAGPGVGVGSGSIGASTSSAAAPAGAGAQQEMRECSMCHARPERTFLCGRCQAVRYCSAACQRADWKQHKQACKQLAAGLAPT